MSQHNIQSCFSGRIYPSIKSNQFAGRLIFCRIEESKFFLDTLQSKKRITNILRLSQYLEKTLENETMGEVL